MPDGPGVYVEEASGGTGAMAGVATSILAVVGSFSRGPMRQAHGIRSEADFEREYGGLRADSLASYAIRQFFLNGGRQAWVVRTAATGDNGDDALPGATELMAALPAFDDVDLFNILIVPDTDRLSDADAARVSASATAYAASRRAFYILDPPHLSTVRADVAGIGAWLAANGSLRHANAAAYFPRPMVADPLGDFRLRAVPASGTIAGVYARTDAERGVWKAPAGRDAALHGVQRLECQVTDADNGVLNPLGLNCLRTFQGAGPVCWGARTLVGSDLQASDWKYVPVRRLALFLEESLDRGTRFAVVEPNGEPLWAQIRLAIGTFMHALFLQGAFKGLTPRDAYLVKCDGTTTTQDDIHRGVVNVIVGFAPLTPGEFVIIRIRQSAGQAPG